MTLLVQYYFFRLRVIRFKIKFLSKVLTFLTPSASINNKGYEMKDYLTIEEYDKLTAELKELVEKKRLPTSSSDYAFSYGYDGHMNNQPFLRLYANYINRFPKCTVKDLHALCLGYGTAGHVIDSVSEDDDDGSGNNNSNDKIYH